MEFKYDAFMLHFSSRCVFWLSDTYQQLNVVLTQELQSFVDAREEQRVGIAP